VTDSDDSLKTLMPRRTTKAYYIDMLPICGAMALSKQPPRPRLAML